MFKQYEQKELVTVEALRVGRGLGDWVALRELGIDCRVEKNLPYYTIRGIVNTNHGPVEFCSGDWLRKAANGELYPCSDDTFYARYRKVEENELRKDAE